VNTLLPSGDQVTRETPPPPNLLSGVHVSRATSQARMAVSTGEADIKTRPSGLHERLVTGL
jgi:hypothetical protein